MTVSGVVLSVSLVDSEVVPVVSVLDGVAVVVTGSVVTDSVPVNQVAELLNIV